MTESRKKGQTNGSRISGSTKTAVAILFWKDSIKEDTKVASQYISRNIIGRYAVNSSDWGCSNIALEAK